MDVAHAHHHPAGRQGLNHMALVATLHCLTGCAIGEVLGMVLATWWGWSDVPSIALAVVLAFFFGVPVNRWMIARGKGHAAAHSHH